MAHYTPDDSDVILTIVFSAAMLEV